MNPQNGKGSSPRKNQDQKKYAENWDKIFGEKCDKTSKNKPGN